MPSLSICKFLKDVIIEEESNYLKHSQLFFVTHIKLSIEWKMSRDLILWLKEPVESLSLKAVKSYLW